MAGVVRDRSRDVAVDHESNNVGGCSDTTVVGGTPHGLSVVVHHHLCAPFPVSTGHLRSPLVIAMTLIVRTLVYNVGSLTSQVLTYSIGLFFITMSLHGELVRLRPAPRRLTDFYLVIAAGGASAEPASRLSLLGYSPGSGNFTSAWSRRPGSLESAGFVRLAVCPQRPTPSRPNLRQWRGDSLLRSPSSAGPLCWRDLCSWSVSSSTMSSPNPRTQLPQSGVSTVSSEL